MLIKRNVDVLVIGGGASGLAAAVSAKESGAEKVLVIERNERLGGILNQCIHDGFGLEIFQQSLTGPEYMQYYIDRAASMGVEFLFPAMVIDVQQGRVYASSEGAVHEITAKSIVFATGCRERTAGSICLPGSRPAGIFTAGTAQHYINCANKMIGRKAVILGSGNIGMIMARRLHLEGCKVESVVEILPYHTGLIRNRVQCLEDWGIPLLLEHTVSRINGRERLTSVNVAQVDEKQQIVPSTEREIKCDTLILSVGLIPENELLKKVGAYIDMKTGGPIVDGNFMTSIPGIFTSGNSLHVHDIVDWATLESCRAGRNSALFSMGTIETERSVEVGPGEGVRYVIPQKVFPEKDSEISFRADIPGKSEEVLVTQGQEIIFKKFFRWVHPSEMIKVKIPKGVVREGKKVQVRLRRK